jgi:hypothetical protein
MDGTRKRAPFLQCEPSGKIGPKCGATVGKESASYSAADNGLAPMAFK